MTVNTFGSFQTERTGRTAAAWLWPFIPISFSAFSLSALFYYHLHHGMELQSPLQLLYARIYEVFGLAPSVMFFAFTLTWSSIWFATGTIERPASRLAKLFAMAVMLGIFINLGSGGVVADVHKGSLGAWLAGVLYAAFGGFPSLVLVWAVTFASFVLATDFFFSDRFERLRQATEPASEGGVEPAVTEHLRTLAAVAPEPLEPNPLASALATGAIAAVPTTATSALAEAERPAATGRSITELVFQDEPEPLVTVRRSYAERAAERAARREAARAEAAAAREPEVVAEPEAAAVETPAASADVAPPAPVEPAPIETAPIETAPPPAMELADAFDAPGEMPAFELPASEAPVEFAEPEPPVARAIASEVELAPPLVEASHAEIDAMVSPATETPPERDHGEPVFNIPRPASRSEPTPVEEPVRQQNLFGSGLDEALLQDATEIVTRSGRASASLLQRKLRIDYLLARDVMAALAARGVIALDGDAAGGRAIS